MERSKVRLLDDRASLPQIGEIHPITSRVHLLHDLFRRSIVEDQDPLVRRSCSAVLLYADRDRRFFRQL